MSTYRKRVYAHVKNDKLIIDNMDQATGWVGSVDVSDVDINTNHREGTNSLSFDKDGTTVVVGTISKTLDTENQLNLVDYLRGKFRFWINLSSLTNVSKVSLVIGEDATDNYVYDVADTELSTGWNEVTFNVDSPTSTGGDGAAWSSIGYIAITVTFDATGDTLTEILVDALSVLYEPEVNIESVNLSGSGLSTAALQTTGNAILTTIDADTGTIAGDTTSIDGKTPALGTALMAASAPVTIATDDTVATDLTAIKTAVETLDNAIAGNEMQVDVVTSALPTGAATEATLSTVDTNTGNAATSLAIVDDWDNAASDGASVSGDTAHDAVDAGEPVKIGGKAADPTSLPAAVAVNDRVNAAYSPEGEQLVYKSRNDPGDDSTNDVVKTEYQGMAATISTATTTTVKASAGRIRKIRAVGGTMGTVTIYDNTAGSGTEIVPVVTPAQGDILVEDYTFTQGLTIVTGAATVLIINYR